MFKQKLARVVNNIEGAVGCMLIGFDGIAIDSVFKDQELPQMSAIAIELSNLLDKFRRLQVYDVGEVNEVSITTGNITTLARVVAEISQPAGHCQSRLIRYPYLDRVRQITNREEETQT